MKVFIALLLISAVFADESKEEVKEDKYPTKYDNINVDEILASDRLLQNHYNCLMDRGSCTNEMKELKKRLPDALKTECSKCSEKQREVIERVFKFLVKNKPKEWEDLKAKYDPEGIYLEKYRPEAKKHGIEV